MNENLIFKKDGVEYMKLCLDLSVYWTGSVFDHADGVLKFYNTALEVIGDELKYYATEEMPEAEMLTDEAWELLPRWLSENDKSKDIFSLNLESHADPDMPSDTALDFWAVEYPEDPAGMIRLILPIQFIDESAQRFVDLAQRLTVEMQFHSGHGGYAINWDHKGMYAFPARKEMSVLSRRYPGIELPEVVTTLMALYDGMKRINWLTLVGNSLLARLEDEEAVVNSLTSEEDILVHRLPGGLIIVAGREPKLGDVNRQEDLGPYHEVGKALTPLRSRDHPPFLVNKKGFPDEEVTEVWLSFFDGEAG